LKLRVEGVDPLSWLAAQKSKTKIYWSDRAGAWEAAGVGVADMVAAAGGIDYHEMFDRMRRLLAADVEELRYYGGVRFNGRSTGNENTDDSVWDGFGGYRFVLPRFEMIRQSGDTFLVCNFTTADTEMSAIIAELDALAWEVEPVAFEPLRLVSRFDNPDRAKWQGMVESALDAMEKGDLDKLVLARQVSFEFSESLSPSHLVASLKSTTADCYHFCFQFDNTAAGTVAFIGASPERLYHRRGRHLKSEAVAGTRPRSSDAAEDDRLGAELLRSEKERQEHHLVVAGIRQALQPLSQSVSCDEDATLLKLTRLQHLRARFEGTLSDIVTDAEILEALHPTPAVGGYPFDAAGAWLNGRSSVEPFDRGWYAGPVGWVARDEVEFAVGIRSGMVVDKKLHLFAGAGIVKGSTPEGEWDEIENKIDNFITALVTP